VRRIAHLSDVHFGRHDPIVVTALLESLNALSPDLVVISGDLTQRARRHQFRAARAFLDRITWPHIVVPGNHDIPLYNLFARLTSPFANYERYIGPADAYPFFIDDEIAVLGLNSVRPLNWKNGRVEDHHLAEMEARFRAVPSHVWKILVTHHPLASIKGARPFKMAERSAPAVKAAVRSGVHLVLSGHSHYALNGAIDEELEAGGSLLVVHAGTAVSTRTRWGQVNTYNVITIAPPRLSIRIMEWSRGIGFREGAYTEHLLSGSTWQLAA
jgi:3',5'-cyclic AMP phosphodiesterase CpdA